MPKKVIPKFDFTGEYTTSADDDYWYIYLKSTGVLVMDWPKTADLFLCGGGGAGGESGGGGGGYTKTAKRVSVDAGTEYDITVGLGGAYWGEDGKASSAFGFSAAGGGHGDSGGAGGNGGSGGGAGTYEKPDYGGYSGNGGSNGSNGGASDLASGGRGQGSTTHAFADSRYPLYGGGGGGVARRGSGGAGGAGGGGNGEGQDNAGNKIIATAGEPNTGGGGGGGTTGGFSGYGGSGIVIIRSADQDYLPVFFNDTRVQEIYYNGNRMYNLTFNGAQLF